MAVTKVRTVPKSISLPEDVLEEAERLAAIEGRSLSNFIALALRRQIAGEIEIEKPEAVS